MKEHSQVGPNSAENGTSDETSPGITIEAIIAMVSYLESEIQPRNPIAAYFLARCRSSLLQDILNNQDLRAKHSLAGPVAARAPIKAVKECEQSPQAAAARMALQYLDKGILKPE
jgi:hypothetical protein